jgi:hypothetical protein
MDQGPLVTEEIDAGAKLAREFGRYKPVKAAFWLKASDEEQRYLYLASDEIDDTNFDLAYGEILRLANQSQSPYLDPFRVMVIGGGDPLARAAAEIIERFPAQIPTRLRGQMFGGIFVDDVYIYPPTLQVTAS